MRLPRCRLLAKCANQSAEFRQQPLALPIQPAANGLAVLARKRFPGQFGGHGQVVQAAEHFLQAACRHVVVAQRRAGEERSEEFERITQPLVGDAKTMTGRRVAAQRLFSQLADLFGALFETTRGEGFEPTHLALGKREHGGGEFEQQSRVIE